MKTTKLVGMRVAVCLLVGVVGVKGLTGQGLTAKEQAARDEGWRQEIRKQLYVPAQLSALGIKTWSTLSGAIVEREGSAKALHLRGPLY